MTKIIDNTIIGKKFGKLIIWCYHHTDKRGYIYYLCKCDCGNIKVMLGNNVKRGLSKSCGSCNIFLMIGYRVGKLTVLEYAKTGKNGHYFRCKCDCGNTKIILGGNLKRNHARSCGSCVERQMIGNKYGKLTVMAFSHKRDYTRYYQCECDCGGVITIKGGSLTSGHTKSCGSCIINETIGKLFGSLRPISYKKTNNKTMFLCECVCGNTTYVSANDLKTGHSKSCGCERVKNRRSTSLDKYGKEHHFMVPEIAIKASKSSNFSHTLKHWKTGKELICIGSYEKAAVEYLNKNKIDFIWQPKSFNMVIDGKKTTYRPDLYIIGLGRWVEIKGYKRPKNMKKYKYFSTHIRINSELWDQEKLTKMGLL